MIELPFDYNAAVVTECWTFYRLAIIQTTPFGREWLASHLRVFMQRRFRVYFGENFQIYYHQYYHDILRYEGIDIRTLPPESLVDLLKRHVRQGRYTLVECDFDQLNGQPSGKPVFHEILVYGFDDERQVFFTPVLGASRRFSRWEVPYACLIESYRSMRKYMTAHPAEQYHLMNHYHYMVTRISIDPHYRPDDTPIMAIAKMREEALGCQFTETDFGREVVYSTGIGCLKGMKESGLMTAEDGVDEAWIVNSVKKLHEHRRIILSTMHYLQKMLQLDEAMEIGQYEQSCRLLEIGCNFAMKHQATGETENLRKLAAYLDRAYEIERQILWPFIQLCTDRYIAYLVGASPSNDDMKRPVSPMDK